MIEIKVEKAAPVDRPIDIDFHNALNDRKEIVLKVCDAIKGLASVASEIVGTTRCN